MILIPEVVLLTYTKEVLKLLRSDLISNNLTPEESLLYLLFGDNKIEKYNFFEQLKSVLERDIDHSKYLEVDLMFNMKRDKAPTIHITIPGEQSGQNSLGVGIGNEEPVYILNGQDEKTDYYETFQRRYKATYDIVITSDNSNEVVALYHLLKAIYTSLQIPLSLEGLENISLSGQDLSLYTDNIPKNMFIRAIRIQMEYETATIDLLTHPVFNSFVATASLKRS